MPSAPSVTLELRASRIERRLAGALLVASVLSLCLASWPIAIRAAAFVVLLSFAFLVARRRGWTDRAARIEWAADGHWWLHPGNAPAAVRDGQADAPVGLRLCEHHLAGPLIALRFCADEPAGWVARWRSRRTLVLWPDSADADALRRLRIRLARLQPDEQGSQPLDGVG